MSQNTKIGFTGTDKAFPDGTQAVYSFVINNGQPQKVTAAPFEITANLGVGTHTVTVQLEDQFGTALAPLVTGSYTVAAPITVTISVPDALVFTPV